MIRRAFTMRLKPDSLSEYKHHHDNIWPELVAEIERAGIASITTFQRGLDLFLVSEIADEAAWDKLWSSEVHKRWADVMQPLMHLREDGIVDAGDLTEVFHISTNGEGEAMAIVVVEPPRDTMMEMIAIQAEAADEPSAARLRRKRTAQQLKKAAGGKKTHKKSAPAKKAKHQAAKRAKKRAAKKAVRKAAKKSAPKKAKKGGKKRG